MAITEDEPDTAVGSRLEMWATAAQGITQAPWLGHGIRARETAMRVAAGAIAKKYLATQGIVIRGYMSQLGPIAIPFVSWDHVLNNPFYAANDTSTPELEAYMDQLRHDGDSVGARIEVVADGLPVGWGEPIYDRLDADIAFAMMGLNAVKGVEIGAGFKSIEQRGSEHGDEITPEGFLTNNAGGVLGGISSGRFVGQWWSWAVRQGGPVDLNRLRVLAFEYLPGGEE